MSELPGGERKQKEGEGALNQGLSLQSQTCMMMKTKYRQVANDST